MRRTQNANRRGVEVRLRQGFRSRARHVAPARLPCQQSADFNDPGNYYLDPGNTGISLKVAGKIESEEIEVKDMSSDNINSKSIKTENLNVKLNNTADFVFYKDYNLLSLEEVEKYIKDNKHLPGIPSGEELVKNGMDVAEMNNLLLQKIEELTLYILELKKENNSLRIEIEKINK